MRQHVRQQQMYILKQKGGKGRRGKGSGTRLRTGGRGRSPQGSSQD